MKIRDFGQERNNAKSLFLRRNSINLHKDVFHVKKKIWFSSFSHELQNEKFYMFRDFAEMDWGFWYKGYCDFCKVRIQIV